MTRFATVLIAIVAAAAGSGCAIMSSSEADQMQKDIHDMKMDLSRMKEENAAANSKMLYSLQAIEEKLDIREESIGSTLRNVDERLADFSANMEAIAQPAPAPTAMAESSMAATPSAAAPGVLPDQLFREAVQAWTDADYDRALAKYQQFLQLFPSHPRAPEAQFWIGECHYSKGEYPQAIVAYQQVLDRYPGSKMEAEAAAKIGYCYYKMNDRENARKALQRVVNLYPTYDQIDKVKETLGSL